MGEGAGWWKWELAVPELSLPVLGRLSFISLLGPGRVLGRGSHRRQPRPLLSPRPRPQDLSTQLSRTGTLSRKSIKAPATPASATLG